MGTRRLVLGIVVALGVALGAFVLVPSPVDPAPYTPEPPRPLVGPLAPNEALRAVEVMPIEGIHGPEDVAVDAQGRVYMGSTDGRVVRLVGDRVETFATTGGRPLGLDFAPSGELIVCDSEKGLLSIDTDGRVRVLTTEAEGGPFRFTNDVEVASDGRIYFSDASTGYKQPEYLYSLLDARARGRLLRYDPTSEKTEVLLRDLYFANGIALSRDESFLLVNETYRYRIQRYFLTGARAGQSEVFMDRLPGFPDGISTDDEGRFWLALYSVRRSLLDDVLHPRPWLKALLAKVPRPLWPKPERYGLVLVLDEDGQVVQSLHDPGGERIFEVTSAEPYGRAVYFGTLVEPRIARLRLE